MVIIIGEKSLKRYLSQFGMAKQDLFAYKSMNFALVSYEKEEPVYQETIKNLNEKINAIQAEKDALMRELKDRPFREPTKEEVEAKAKETISKNANDILLNIGGFEPSCEFYPNGKPKKEAESK
jgi:hypothetical protein